MSDVATIPGRHHVARVRDHHVRRYVRGHKPLCYALTILFILLLILI